MHYRTHCCITSIVSHCSCVFLSLFYFLVLFDAFAFFPFSFLSFLPFLLCVKHGGSKWVLVTLGCCKIKRRARDRFTWFAEHPGDRRWKRCDFGRWTRRQKMGRTVIYVSK